ncbi:hypothetical protein AAG906_035865 [Vitis piasezkii]
MKVIQSGFWWPSLFKDAHTMCKGCDRCQRLGKLTRQNMMPLNPILIVDVFDVWGIDFMGPFPMSFGHSYILVGVDYVSKWVEAIPCRSNDHRVVLKFLKENIFARFGVPKAIIMMEEPTLIGLLSSWIPYGLIGPLTRPFLECLLIALFMAKRAIFQREVEYKAWWAIKKLNMDLKRAGLKRCLDLNELEEMRHDAYLNSKIAKERWTGPFIIHDVQSNGVVELLNFNSTRTFKVNGHRLKPYMESFSRDKEEFILLDPPPT